MAGLPGRDDTLMPSPRIGIDELGLPDLFLPGDEYADEFSRPHPPPKPDFPQEPLDIYGGVCNYGVDHHCRCPNRPTPLCQGPTTRPATTTPKTLRRGKCNAIVQDDKMESSTDAGAPAASASTTAVALLPETPATTAETADGIVQPEAQTNGGFAEHDEEAASRVDAPQTPHPMGRPTQEETRDVRPETPNTEVVANILANGPIYSQGEQQIPLDDLDSAVMAGNARQPNGHRDSLPESDFGQNYQSWSVDGGEPLDSENAEGYAKLVFPDGDYIITTYDVEVGRNMEIFRHFKREEKRVKREQRRERVPPAKQESAQRDLEMYQQEPSQPSLPGDDGQLAGASRSSHSLEGRPAPQTTFSETGGALAFVNDSDDEPSTRRGRRKRRSMQYSKSSTSTTSVAPANLHPTLMTAHYSVQELFADDGEPFQRTLATLPIHTQRPKDITKISKKHLLFSFNFQEECWKLNVLGKGAFVNDEYFHEGDTVRLNHNDEIQILSVMIKFKLPDSHRHSPGLTHGTFSQVGYTDRDDLSVDEEQTAETSPVRRLSNAFDDAASSDNEAAEPKKGIPKLKLKGLKKSRKEKKGAAGSKHKPQEEEKAVPKISLKKQQRRRSNESPSSDADKKAEENKVEKGNKPRDAAKQPADAEDVKQSIEEPPAPPVFTAEPGSALANVPVDELPQKRKGPGRPPKNGLVSKRDQALVRKKERDFEKSGQPIPPFKALLELVRHETKQKELLAKMQSGALPPGTEMPPAPEMDVAAAASRSSAVVTSIEAGDHGGGQQVERRPSSPRPKRTARSPSPMKPETEYTEEDMKKPSATYVHILDEILRDHPTGQADLQEIYDRIQKRYPYFRYRVTTTGWQSSVRHNLLSAPRFKETGRSGKGKLWTIDHEVPLEREKKKKPTPPPRPMPMMNGQYMQYGQQPYGNGYGAPPNGQRPVNGGPGYYSPYPSGQPGQQHPGSHGPNRHGPSPAGQANANGTAQQQPDPFGGLVPEILALRTAFLEPYTNAPNMQEKSEWIGKCIMIFSNRFHGSGDRPDLTVGTDEEKKAYANLDALFTKYEALKAKQQQEQQNGPSIPPAQQPATAANAPMPVPSTSANDISPSAPAHVQQHPQTVQTAVADGVAFQNANGALKPTTSHAPAAPSVGSSSIPQGIAGQNSAHSGAVRPSASALQYSPAALNPASGPSMPTTASASPATGATSYAAPYASLPSYGATATASASPAGHAGQYAPPPSRGLGLNSSVSPTVNAGLYASPPVTGAPTTSDVNGQATTPLGRIPAPDNAGAPARQPSSHSPVQIISQSGSHLAAPAATLAPMQASIPSEVRTTSPAPDMRPSTTAEVPTETTGTKRAADGDIPTDDDAKRAKLG